MSTEPIIVGAGPAGSAAAIRLARAGHRPILIDRYAEAGDPICGGFLSWQTVGALQSLGVDPSELNAPAIRRLAIYTVDGAAVADLPSEGRALSRRTLDNALRDAAKRQGARTVLDHVRAIANGEVAGKQDRYRSDSIFLASGKTDIRGEARPRTSDDPALGIRVRTCDDSEIERLVGDKIELHLFRGGYAGVVMQEDGRANICLAVRKSLLSQAGGDPRILLENIAGSLPAFAARLRSVPADAPIDTVSAVPYGWRVKQARPGLFRLGDQAAVIPSLAGEGMGIALASAEDAIAAFLQNGPSGAARFQHAFARRSRRPVVTAGLLWRAAETSLGSRLLRSATDSAPALAHLAMRLSRI